MSVVPAQFFGTWVSEKDENFDEFLASKGVPWLARTAVIAVALTIKYTDLGSGKYGVEHSIMGMKAQFEFRLGEEFLTTLLENVERKLTITVEGSSLVERHQFDSKAKKYEPVDKQYYTVENGQLVQRLNNGSVSCKRYFKKKI